MDVRGVATAGAIPHVPFIEGKPQFFRGAFVPADEVANGDGLLNLFFHAQVHCKEFRAVAAGFLPAVRKIAVKRESIHILVTLLQNFAIPLKVRGHERAA